MMRGVLTWLALALAAGGAGWTWYARRTAGEPVVPAACELHAAAGLLAPGQPRGGGPAIEPHNPPAALPGEELERAARRAAEYVPGAGDEGELEAFWRECGPIPPEDLEPLLAELQRRVELFERMRERHSPATRVLPPPSGVWTTDDFFAEYSEVGLAEARFLVEECIAGRMREAPFIPVPPTVLDSSHPSAQLVPHHSASSAVGYVARLEKDLEPGLFAERPRIYSLAEQVVAGQPRDTADAPRAESTPPAGER